MVLLISFKVKNKDQQENRTTITIMLCLVKTGQLRGERTRFINRMLKNIEKFCSIYLLLTLFTAAIAWHSVIPTTARQLATKKLMLSILCFQMLPDLAYMKVYSKIYFVGFCWLWPRMCTFLSVLCKGNKITNETNEGRKEHVTGAGSVWGQLGRAMGIYYSALNRRSESELVAQALGYGV